MLRHQRIRREQDHFVVTEKRCTQCRVMKPVPDGYVMRRRTLKCGEVRVYPSPECRECGAIRREKWKADYIAEHGEEAWKEKQRSHSRTRNKKKKRRYGREYDRIRRIEKGAKPRGPWKKYRDEVGKLINPYDKVTALPFRQWWRSLPQHRRQRIISGDETLRRAIDSNLQDDRPNVTKLFLHQIAEAADDPLLLKQLSSGLW